MNSIFKKWIDFLSFNLSKTLANLPHTISAMYRKPVPNEHVYGRLLSDVMLKRIRLNWLYIIEGLDENVKTYDTVTRTFLAN